MTLAGGFAPCQLPVETLVNPSSLMTSRIFPARPLILVLLKTLIVVDRRTSSVSDGLGDGVGVGDGVMLGDGVTNGVSLGTGSAPKMSRRTGMSLMLKITLTRPNDRPADATKVAKT